MNLLLQIASFHKEELILKKSIQLERRRTMEDSPSLLVTFIDQNYDDPNGNGHLEEETEKEENVKVKQCANYSEECKLTYEDMIIIMNSLNIETHQNEEIPRDNELIMEEVYELLENNNASLKELKHVFHVFDRDEDGFISTLELWSVLRKLGFSKEGMEFEDCEEMIEAFDLDGDGMISFHEFKHMMDNAI